MQGNFRNYLERRLICIFLLFLIFYFFSRQTSGRVNLFSYVKETGVILAFDLDYNSQISEGNHLYEIASEFLGIASCLRENNLVFLKLLITLPRRASLISQRNILSFYPRRPEMCNLRNSVRKFTVFDKTVHCFFYHDGASPSCAVSVVLPSNYSA